MDEAGFDRRRVLTLTGQAAAAAALAVAAEPARAATTDIVNMGARALSKAIAARKVSCADVMAAHLDQIERLNPAHNAVVALQDRDALMKEAKARDERQVKGGPVPPLYGFPHAVKDLQPVKGIRFTRGSPLFKDSIAPADGLLAERLRAAGVIFIGKTNTPEFGFGSHTYNPVYGATHNAFDVAKSAGGSSGGAAVALALRMVPLADGSDYGGSLRNPAGWNNVCGFRTSFGCVPGEALDAWTPSMGVQGPMARNVADLSLLLSVQAGFDARAPLSMAGDGSRFRDPKPTSMKGKRIGWLGDFGGAAVCEPGVLEVCRAALKRFEAIGCVVEEAKPAFDVETAWQAFMRLRAWQQSGQTLPFDKNPTQRALLNDQARFELDLALKLSAFDITAASTVRTQWSMAVQRLFRRFDYLVAPTAQMFAFDVTKRWPTEIAGVSMRTYHEWMKGACLVTLAGCPSLAVPAGFSAVGQAMGLQIIAPVQQEIACLQLGAAFEAVEPLWRTRAPAGVRLA